MFSQTSQSALIIGATGQTGRHLLQELLASSHFTRVGEFGRRVTKKSEIATGSDKLEQKEIDFERIQDSGLSQGEWDVVFITLGTTKANAGSAEAFEKIDREYVINAAKEARNPDPSVPQRVVYLSAGGADPRSPFLYTRSKGLTEQGLADIGYTDTIIIRPGFLAEADRSEHRLVETIYGKITGVLSNFSSSVQIPVSTLGRSMYLAGKLGSEALPPAVAATKEGSTPKFTVIGNAGALKLAESKE